MSGSVARQALPVDAPMAPAARLPVVDVARGAAVAAMIVYHFAWDLSAFGFISANVSEDFGWVAFARLIAASFLFVSGFSLGLADRRGFRPARFLRRLVVIAAAAGAVTLVTWFVFPDSFIFFGILHQIALASVLALPFLRLPVVLTLAAACFLLFARSWLANPLFNAPALLWLGLYTEPPVSNDYVPVFPWTGIVLLGLAAARLAGQGWAWDALARVRAASPIGRALRFAGRHSLAVYLVHQPLLFGLTFAAAQLFPPAAVREGFAGACVPACVAQRWPEAACRAACACVADAAEAEGLSADLLADRVPEERARRIEAIARTCAPGGR
jgi:uncharacterized membrane protein